MKKVIRKIGIMFMGIIILAGCSSQKPITSENFNKIMEKKEMTLVNVAGRYSSNTVKSSYETKEDELYIQYIEFTNVENAQKSFEKTKEDIEVEGKEIEKETKNKKQYKYFIQKKEGYHYYLVMIENTIIYGISTEKYKGVLDEIYEETGYWS